jgi:hypothetical protein
LAGLNGDKKSKYKYCSKDCTTKAQTTKIPCICEQCGKDFLKVANQYKSTKHHFCSQSCAGYYHNSHKTHGFRRSKIEKYIERELKKLFPELSIVCNKVDTIQYELDIYLPELKLAFELNGVVHYKPIYGTKKFKQIKERDRLKKESCICSGIDLYVFNISSIKRFSEESSRPFLSEIVSKINERLGK